MKRYTISKERYRLMIRSLSKDYHDPVELMLHANFQILVDFIEKEKPEEVVNWDYCREQAFVRNEFRSLYYWWKIGRPAAQKYYNRLLREQYPYRKNYELNKIIAKDGKAGINKLHNFETFLTNKDQRQLHRLIKIRLNLWT